MKILMISPLCPLPLERGGTVRVWNIARQLSNHNDVDLVCFIRKDQERVYENELKAVFNNVHFIKRNKLMSARSLMMPGWHKWQFFRDNFKILIKALLTLRPLISVLYDSAQLRKIIFAADKSKSYDLIYSETYYASSSLFDYLCLLHTPYMLCEQNLEYVLYGRQLEEQRNLFVYLGMKWDVWKMKREEIIFWKRARILGGLSQVDVSEMKEQSGREDVFSLENGVDIFHFSQKVSVRNPFEVLFVGSFAYFQNVDAVRWLVDDIWPQIYSTERHATLRIVGRGADVSLVEYLKDRGHYIDQSVDDIREAYQRASVLIAPIRAGSGTKYKVLEAMASRTAVVTTAVGAEGLEVKDGKEMVVKQNSDELADAVVRLLYDHTRRENLTNDAYNFVKEYYDWKAIISRFEKHVLSNVK